MVENCRYTIAPTVATIETVFRTNISVNHLNLYGAVAEKFEECQSCHDGTEGPVVRGQSNPSFVPSVIKTNIPLNDMKNFCCKDIENELKSYHNKTE